MAVDDNISVAMARSSLENLPEHPLPPDFSIRRFYAGDEAHWVRLHELADRYNAVDVQTFVKQFGADTSELADRQFYLLNENDEPIGTATAWYGDEAWGRDWGRVHWVAIVPDYQGRGLAKPLLAVVMHRLRELGHARAYLTTSTARLAAIRLYMQFGFAPEPRDAYEEAAWSRVRAKLAEGRGR